MNIFVLDRSPLVAARHHCDKHVVKMIVETGQMLSTAHWINGKADDWSDGDMLYKPAFVNHPCSKWVRESSANHRWTCALFIGLLTEYTARYKRSHKSERLVPFVTRMPAYTRQAEMTPFVQAMPDEYKCDDSVIAYRRYYLGEKRRFARWRYTEAPAWWRWPSMHNLKVDLTA